MGGEAVCLTVEAIAGSRTQEAAVPRSETVCSRRVWTGGSGEDMVISRRKKKEKKREGKDVSEQQVRRVKW